MDATGFVRSRRRRLVTSAILSSAAAGILGRMRIATLLLAVILGVFASQSAVERTLVISVVDETGAPVMDVTPADVRVREDGIDGEVVSVRRASGALFVQLLIDTTPGIEPYVSDIRKALVGVVQQVKQGDPAAELGLMEFGQAAVPIVRNHRGRIGAGKRNPHAVSQAAVGIRAAGRHHRGQQEPGAEILAPPSDCRVQCRAE